MAVLCRPLPLRAAPATPEEIEKAKERRHWEDVVLFYGDEESGEWSLRIKDQSVTDRAWFEFRELWQFIPKDMCWKQVQTEKFQRPIVLSKQKGSDEPQDSQMLYKFEEIPVHTPGLWYAKWRVDEVDCGTLMRIGTPRSKTRPMDQAPPEGFIKMTVPITLESSEWMILPDPRVYCVPGGPGKPDKAPKK